MHVHLRCLVAIALLPGFCADAAALCPIFGFYRYVGDTASDSQCTDNDIQSAINNASATCHTNIVITREHTYTSQALNIDSKSISLEGVGDGIPCNYQPGVCDPSLGCGGGGGGGPPPAPAVTLHGNGAASVIYIHGNSYVTLQSLELTGGGGTDYGGGVHFTGTGALTLVDTSIVYNSANYGGAIQFNGSGGGTNNYVATLTLGAGTIIEENSAGVHGGAIQINGGARLFALAPYTFIGYNHAPNGHGGGIAIVGPARADIASPGYNGLDVVGYNDAQYGGGIAVDGNADVASTATLRLFTVDANNPVQVSNNTAANTGGGVFVRPNIGGIGFAQLCAYDFRLDNNIAQEGTAVYADLDSDFSGSQIAGDVILNSDPYNDCTAPESPVDLGAVACAPGVACNTMNGNVAEDSSSTAKPGSVVLVQNNGSLEANRLVMRGNKGAHAIRIIDPQVVNDYVDNCLLVDNQLSADVIYAQTGDYVSAIHFSDCTIANNAIGAGSVLHSEFATSLTDSIIDQPGVPTLAYSGGGANLDVSYVLSNDTGTLPVANGIDQGEPDFVNASAGDYHLKLTSIGVDFAPSAGGSDLDRVPRDVDLAPVPNAYGPRDLGAYERQSAFDCDATADAIFCSGFGP